MIPDIAERGAAIRQLVVYGIVAAAIAAASFGVGYTAALEGVRTPIVIESCTSQ